MCVYQFINIYRFSGNGSGIEQTKNQVGILVPFSDEVVLEVVLMFICKWSLQGSNSSLVNIWRVQSQDWVGACISKVRKKKWLHQKKRILLILLILKFIFPISHGNESHGGIHAWGTKKGLKQVALLVKVSQES